MILVRNNTLIYNNKSYQCAIGKSGFTSDKREGDGKTPIGTFALRECWYRADRIPDIATKLPLHIITEKDGWCDDPKSTQYNRHVKLPYSYSHEKLWHEDHVYDVVIPLGYNDDPTVPGRGSAIFLHLAKDDYAPTEGCIALAKQDLLALLPLFSPEFSIEIRAE